MEPDRRVGRDAVVSSALSDFDAGPPPEPPDAAARRKLPLTDLGNAARLVGALAEAALYVDGVGWLVWDGARYSPVAGAERMRALTGDTLVRLLEEEAAAESRAVVSKERLASYMADTGEQDAGVAERKLKAGAKKSKRDFARRCGDMARINGAMTAAASRFLVRLDALDADRRLLQVPNGTLRLDAIADVPEAEDDDERLERWGRALGPPDRASRPTRVCGAAFDPRAEAPGWERFVGLIMPDEAMRVYLQALCGFMLGGQDDERAAFLLGRGGNGKSTVVKALAHVLGDYAQSCRIEMFCEQRNVSTGTTPEEAALPGARVYLAGEPDKNVTLSAGKLKGLTGGDARQANPKHKNVFSYVPVGVPVLQMNEMANVNDPSKGFWRRVFPVQFDVDLDELPPAERRSKSAMEKIIEAEASGILNWLLAGWAIYRAEGIRVPPKAMALKASLQALADPVGQYLGDRTRRGTGRRVRTAELHKDFQLWCEAQGTKPIGAKAFSARLLALDFVQTKSHGHWYWVGVELGSDDDDGGASAAGYTADFQ